MSKFVKSQDYPELKHLSEAFGALEDADESHKQAREQCAHAKSEYEAWRDNTGLRDSRSYGTTLNQRFGEYLACSLREANVRIRLSAAHVLMKKQLREVQPFLSLYRKRPAAARFTVQAMITLDLNFAEACDLVAETKLVLDRAGYALPTAMSDPYVETYLQSRFDEASDIYSRLCTDH